MKPTAPLQNKFQRGCRDTLPRLISFSLGLMDTLVIFAPIAAVLLVGCAAEVPPPPPAEPVVDGQVRTVSPSDIKTVVALAKKRLAETGRGSQPIYHVHVDRSDMITVSHGRLPTPRDKTEEFLIFDRVKGKWHLRDIEIVRGFNIPTS